MDSFRGFIVESQNLLSWFGNSKVVDGQGKPLRVYHGSPYPTFTKFSTSARRLTQHEAGWLGIWFTDDPEVAGNFAAVDRSESEPHPTEKWPDGEPKVYTRHYQDVGGVYAVYLKIENPMVYGGKDGFESMLDDRDEFAEYISGVKGQKGYWRKRYINTNKEEATRAFVAALKAKGHDGVIMNSSVWDAVEGKPHNQYVVFSPSQIKSVYNNKFDSSSDDILHMKK